MKPLCEIIVLDVMPAARALIAKDLVEKHGLTQAAAAKKLGMTQPAISQYRRNLRGGKAGIMEKDGEVMGKINSIAERIARGELSHVDATNEFCEICKLMRRRLLLCETHKKYVAGLDNCRICEKKAVC
ncbi:MAG: helix-turn-helix domain-containing protein [Nanoarchaeota archaeon]|nr:helix-turn-helix domain-containing protein [Nanoarchaeota archaeon]